MSFKVLSRVIYGSASPEFWQCKDLRVRPAILHDYCRHQVKYADYPGIVHESGKCVRGTYVTGLTAMDMRRLDNFEGNEYGRVVVKVQLLNEDETVAEGEPGVECSVYVYKYDQHLVDAEWDFELFVKEKMHSWIGDTKTNSG